jgi:hypothetical protein
LQEVYKIVKKNTDNNTIELQGSTEYVVVRYGLGVGIGILARKNSRHPSISQEQVDVLQDQYHDMPIAVPKEALPFEIPIQHAHIALRGLRVATRLANPRAREFSHITQNALENLLSEG